VLLRGVRRDRYGHAVDAHSPCWFGPPTLRTASVRIANSDAAAQSVRILVEYKVLRGLQDQLLRRFAVHNPEWTDYNESDPGVTLLDLFAFLGETLLSRANRLAAPARSKLSIRRCARPGTRSSEGDQPGWDYR
jgi:hypothetical protein